MWEWCYDTAKIQSGNGACASCPNLKNFFPRDNKTNIQTQTFKIQKVETMLYVIDKLRIKGAVKLAEYPEKICVYKKY